MASAPCILEFVCIKTWQIPPRGFNFAIEQILVPLCIYLQLIPLCKCFTSERFLCSSSLEQSGVIVDQRIPLLFQLRDPSFVCRHEFTASLHARRISFLAGCFKLALKLRDAGGLGFD